MLFYLPFLLAVVLSAMQSISSCPAHNLNSLQPLFDLNTNTLGSSLRYDPHQCRLRGIGRIQRATGRTGMPGTPYPLCISVSAGPWWLPCVSRNNRKRRHSENIQSSSNKCLSTRNEDLPNNNQTSNSRCLTPPLSTLTYTETTKRISACSHVFSPRCTSCAAAAPRVAGIQTYTIYTAHIFIAADHLSYHCLAPFPVTKERHSHPSCITGVVWVGFDIWTGDNSDNRKHP